MNINSWLKGQYAILKRACFFLLVVVVILLFWPGTHDLRYWPLGQNYGAPPASTCLKVSTTNDFYKLPSQCCEVQSAPFIFIWCMEPGLSRKPVFFEEVLADFYKQDTFFFFYSVNDNDKLYSFKLQNSRTYFFFSASFDIDTQAVSMLVPHHTQVEWFDNLGDESVNIQCFNRLSSCDKLELTWVCRFPPTQEHEDTPTASLLNLEPTENIIEVWCFFVFFYIFTELNSVSISLDTRSKRAVAAHLVTLAPFHVVNCRSARRHRGGSGRHCPIWTTKPR